MQCQKVQQGGIEMRILTWKIWISKSISLRFPSLAILERRLGDSSWVILYWPGDISSLFSMMLGLNVWVVVAIFFEVLDQYEVLLCWWRCKWSLKLRMKMEMEGQLYVYLYTYWSLIDYSVNSDIAPTKQKILYVSESSQWLENNEAEAMSISLQMRAMLW